MARIILTSAVTIPATAREPAYVVPKGTVLEVTAAQAAVIAGAGGTTRTLSATAGTGAAGNRETLGEAVGVSNASA